MRVRGWFGATALMLIALLAALVGAPVAAAAPPPAPAPVSTAGAPGVVIQSPLSPTDRYIAAVYLLFVARYPDPGGFAYWTPLLDNGMPRTVFVNAVLASRESLRRIESTFFMQALHRAPTDAEFDFWSRYLENTGEIRTFESVVLAGDEAFALDGNHIDAFLGALYTEFLNRSIDPASSSWWNSVLTGGASRGTVASAIAASSEASGKVIRLDYHAMLGRAPDAGGLAFWLGLFDTHAISDIGFVTQLVASNEYYSRHILCGGIAGLGSGRASATGC